MTVNGSIEAGYYATMTITILNKGDAGNGYTGATTGTDVVYGPQQVPVTATYDSAFNPIAYINAGGIDEGAADERRVVAHGRRQ